MVIYENKYAKRYMIFTYYNVRPAKLAPNSPKNTKKCDLVDFSSEIVSIKALKDLEYLTLSLKLSNITQMRISIIHILFLVPATGSGLHILIAIKFPIKPCFSHSTMLY